jgi:hypothetical protein
MKVRNILLLSTIIMVLGAIFLLPENSTISTVVCICGFTIGLGIIISLAYKQALKFYHGDNAAGIILLKGIFIWTITSILMIYFINKHGLKGWAVMTASSKFVIALIVAVISLLLPNKFGNALKRFLREIASATLFDSPRHP